MNALDQSSGTAREVGRYPVNVIYFFIDKRKMVLYVEMS